MSLLKVMFRLKALEESLDSYSKTPEEDVRIFTIRDRLIKELRYGLPQQVEKFQELDLKVIRISVDIGIKILEKSLDSYSKTPKEDVHIFTIRDRLIKELQYGLPEQARKFQELNEKIQEIETVLDRKHTSFSHLFNTFDDSLKNGKEISEEAFQGLAPLYLKIEETCSIYKKSKSLNKKYKKLYKKIDKYKEILIQRYLNKIDHFSSDLSRKELETVVSEWKSFAEEQVFKSYLKFEQIDNRKKIFEREIRFTEFSYLLKNMIFDLENENLLTAPDKTERIKKNYDFIKSSLLSRSKYAELASYQEAKSHLERVTKLLERFENL